MDPPALISDQAALIAVFTLVPMLRNAFWITPDRVDVAAIAIQATNAQRTAYSIRS